MHMGGSVEVCDKDGVLLGSMLVGEHGGVVSVVGKSKPIARQVRIAIDEHGGIVNVVGKDRQAYVGTDKDGGHVAVLGKEGQSVILSTDEYGGVVIVNGKDTNIFRAVMDVNEDGNGEVSTWDKRGYRLATLK